MDRISASRNNLVFGVLSNILTIFSGLLLVPYYLKFFTIGAYGAWVASIAVFSIISSMEGGLSMIFTQKLAYLFSIKDIEKFRVTVGSIAAYSIIISVIFTSIILGLKSSLPLLINCPLKFQEDLSSALGFSGLGILFGVLNNFAGSLPQAWQDTFMSNISRILSQIIYILVVVILLNYNLGLIALGIGFLLRELTYFFLILTFIITKWFKLKINHIKFSLPDFISFLSIIKFPFFGRIAKSFIDNSQNAMISIFISSEASAIYAFTVKIPIMMKQFILIFINSFFGGLSSLRANKKYKNKVSDTLLLTIFLTFIVSIFNLLFTSVIINYWVGPENYGGDYLLLIVIIAYSASMMFDYFYNLAIIEEKYNFATAVVLSSGILYYVISYILFIFLDFSIYSIPISFSIVTFFSGIVLFFQFFDKNEVSKIFKSFNLFAIFIFVLFALIIKFSLLVFMANISFKIFSLLIFGLMVLSLFYYSYNIKTIVRLVLPKIIIKRKYFNYFFK